MRLTTVCALLGWLPLGDALAVRKQRSSVALRGSSELASEVQPAAESIKAPAAPTVVPVVSGEWELDCFSRPVVVDGKKLWELLITDATGTWRDVTVLPANAVNSVAVRAAVEDVISRAPVKPRTIRFFRKQMFNMLKIALEGVASSRPTLRIRPSRATHSLFAWLEERHAEVYPTMAGYDAKVAPPAFSLKPVATKLPETMRGEQFAFVTLPLAEVLAGGSVDASNIGVGTLISPSKALLEAAPADAMLPGVALLTRRAAPVAMSIASSELAVVRADLASRQLVLDLGLEDSYLVARLDDSQRAEAANFEKEKAKLGGLHFIVVQKPEGEEEEEVEPAGFWLLRELDASRL